MPKEGSRRCEEAGRGSHRSNQRGNSGTRTSYEGRDQAGRSKAGPQAELSTPGTVCIWTRLFFVGVAEMPIMLPPQL